MQRALVPLVLLSSGLVFAQSVLLDRVIAIVDGEAILRSEVLQRAQRQTPQPTTAETRAQLFAVSRAELIDEKLIRLDAKKLRLELSVDEVSRGLAALAEGNHMSVDALLAEVSKRGVSEKAYRRIVEDQILEYRWLNVKLDGKLAQLNAAEFSAQRARLVGQLRENAAIEVAP